MCTKIFGGMANIKLYCLKKNFKKLVFFIMMCGIVFQHEKKF